MEDVTDSLNLMVDKIQECMDNKNALEYFEDGRTVKLEKMREWQAWFINNREIYCLDEFYNVQDGRIIGEKLFENQSLTHPYPKDLNEIKEYL